MTIHKPLARTALWILFGLAAAALYYGVWTAFMRFQYGA